MRRVPERSIYRLTTAEMIAMYKNGVKVVKIACAAGAGPATVNKRLVRAGVKG